MNCRWAWMLPLLSIATVILGNQGAQAQGPMGPGGPPPGMMMGPGGPGMMGGAPPGMYDPDSMGGQGIMGPGGPPGGMMGPGGMGPGGMGPGGMGMGPSGDMMGCPPDGGGYGGGGHGHNGLLGDVLGILAPYGDGGCAAPRWFDFDVGIINLKREGAGVNRPFTSLGVAGPVVLQTDDLDFDDSTSFKFSAMMQCGAGSNLEFTYYGLFGWDASARATGPGTLRSVYSQFGQDPGANGFLETDLSNVQRLDYTSTFDNFEVNFRQRWQSPHCRYQGSWLYGLRYFKLDEDFDYRTLAVANSSRTNVNTNNSLTGLQVGGDVWICLIPGLKLGGEGKFGVFGNHQNIDTRLNLNGNPVAAFEEELNVGDVAFIGDLAAYATYRINYNWNLKVGYQALYVEGVALASDNFNPVPPDIFLANGSQTRVPTAQRNGNVFYHGFNASLEYLW
ncbi:hypothetical protein NA78x_001608 [Anatilimnocola sp. NA78]|uniref:hypothetical protein n=1 Tax=Anatilimnocola sp. NA78 TaxID=3415683 RepID=UPI003CE4FC99